MYWVEEENFLFFAFFSGFVERIQWKHNILHLRHAPVFLAIVWASIWPKNGMQNQPTQAALL